VVCPRIPFSVAEIVVVPKATADTKPDAETVATVVGVEDQVALLVKSAVVPSLYVPVATSCCEFPVVTVGPAGVSAIEVRVAWELPPELALEAILPPQALSPRAHAKPAMSRKRNPNENRAQANRERWEWPQAGSQVRKNLDRRIGKQSPQVLCVLSQCQRLRKVLACTHWAKQVAAESFPAQVGR
jgi:hypothetical protein